MQEKEKNEAQDVYLCIFLHLNGRTVISKLPCTRPVYVLAYIFENGSQFSQLPKKKSKQYHK